MVGVEPTRGCPHKILSLARLPIPSHRHMFMITKTFQISNKILKNFLYINLVPDRLIKLNTRLFKIALRVRSYEKNNNLFIFNYNQCIAG